MDKKTIENFMKAYKDGNGALKPDVKSFIKPSHLEELSPLFECHLEAVVVRKDEFHELEGGKTYMPRKETMDKFAQAAGVSYNEAAEKTWKEGDTCYVGRSQGMIMGPDGKWILGDVCEYEFDADVRTEEARLNGAPDWEHKVGNRPGKRDYTEKELASQRVQFLKVGRQRANTGARQRATVAILGMPTGCKGLFDKNEGDAATRTFLFSRIIVNAKNEMVMNAMLTSLGSNAQALFGPIPAASKALAAPQSTQGAPAGDEPFAGDARPAANATTTFEDDDIPFGEKSAAPAQAPAASDEELDRAMVDLEAWANHPNTPEAVAKAITGLMDRGENRRDVIIAVLQLLQNLNKTHAPKIVTAISTMILDAKADANAILVLSGQIDTAIQNYKGGQK